MKEIRLIFTYLLLIFSCYLLAQNHDYIWLSGYQSSAGHPNLGGTVIDFNEEPPFLYKEERGMNIDVTVASICDSLGNLLFYTNGVYIANAINEMMENGDSLNPSQITWEWSSSGLPVFQSEIILPMPNSPYIYYLFHLVLDYHNTWVLARPTLHYSIIDMSKNNGLGAVLEKNQIIISDANLNLSEISAVKHGNGRDWWIVVPDAFSESYYKYLLTPSGIDTLPVQTISNDINELTNGTIVFSPDGSRMVRYEVPLYGVFIYDFDRCTGMLESNPGFIPMPELTLGGGVAISPNSRFLYMTSSQEMYQMDLWADDMEASLELIAEYDGFISFLPTSFYNLQLGPDGRIYGNTNNGTNIFHIINQPNKKGKACEVIQHGMQLPTINKFTSHHFPNYRLGALDGSPCDTLGFDNHPLAGFSYTADSLLFVEFTDNSFYEPEDWFWDFGDGDTSTEMNPVHEFPAEATYTVCLTVSNVHSSDTFCREMLVSALRPNFSWDQSTKTVTFTDLTPSNPTEWLWTFGDGDSSTVQHPVHEYPGYSNYDVCLTVWDEVHTDTYCEKITLALVNVEETKAEFSFEIFPNPAFTEVTIASTVPFSSNSEWLLYNQLGQAINRESLSTGQQAQTISLENVPAGVYFYAVLQQGRRLNGGKLIISK